MLSQVVVAHEPVVVSTHVRPVVSQWPLNVRKIELLPGFSVPSKVRNFRPRLVLEARAFRPVRCPACCHCYWGAQVDILISSHVDHPIFSLLGYHIWREAERARWQQPGPFKDVQKQFETAAGAASTFQALHLVEPVTILLAHQLFPQVRRVAKQLQQVTAPLVVFAEDCFIEAPQPLALKVPAEMIHAQARLS